MKVKVLMILIVVLIVGIIGYTAVQRWERPERAGRYSGCNTIQSGEIIDASDNVITVGYDAWGYNYQAHLYNGYYDNYSRPDVPVEDGGTWLQMKWSDTWLSNRDCNLDKKLDRGYSCNPVLANSSACPGAWLTNHQFGTYEDENGEMCVWNYFVKIVAVDPESAYVDSGFWFTFEGVEIGEVIWGSFAIIQQVDNDPCADLHGIQYKSPAGPGLGKY